MKSPGVAAKTQCSPPTKKNTHTHKYTARYCQMIYVTQNQVQMEWKQSKINTLYTFHWVLAYI